MENVIRTFGDTFLCTCRFSHGQDMLCLMSKALLRTFFDLMFLVAALYFLNN